MVKTVLACVAAALVVACNTGADPLGTGTNPFAPPGADGPGIGAPGGDGTGFGSGDGLCVLPVDGGCPDTPVLPFPADTD